MKPAHIIALVPAMIVACAWLTGCGPKKGDGHNQGKVVEHGGDDGHDHGEESSFGVSFKEGKGLLVSGGTQKLLGVEVADVTEQRLPNQIRFTVQVFGEKHHHLLNPQDHAGCDVYGSGFVSLNTASAIRVGQPVQLLKETNSSLDGVVLAVQKALALGESEVVIGVSNATASLESGEFVPARINLPRDEPMLVVPRSALLRTSEGPFVYVVNGNAYLRTAVTVEAEADDWVGIGDGLFAGDQVVTQPVETFWLIELRATKGGGHSH